MHTAQKGAVDSIYAFFDETVTALGESGWQSPPSDGNVDGQIPQACRLSDGSEGVRYSTLLDGPAQEDPAAAAGRVAAYWRSRGLEVIDRIPASLNDPQIRTRAANESLVAEYTVDTKASFLEIISRCVPGDQEAISDEVAANRERAASAIPSPTPPTG